MKRILEIVQSRYRLFGKYGQGFDLRLFTEIEAYIRICVQFREKDIIVSDPSSFRKISKIQRKMLKKGQKKWGKFPHM